MGKITTVTLDDHATAFLEAQVAAGHFASTDAALTEAVRLLEARDTALAALRAEIQKGEDSGYDENFDFETFLVDLKAGRAA